jgi:hypothetical protein
MHAHEMHAHEMHAHEMHAHEVHAHEVHAREMHSREVHAYETHAHALEIKVLGKTSRSPTLQTVVRCGTWRYPKAFLDLETYTRP